MALTIATQWAWPAGAASLLLKDGRTLEGNYAQIGSVAATYVLEHLGGQSHAYSLSEFLERYEATFGALPAPSSSGHVAER